MYRAATPSQNLTREASAFCGALIAWPIDVCRPAQSAVPQTDSGPGYTHRAASARCTTGKSSAPA